MSDERIKKCQMVCRLNKVILEAFIKWDCKNNIRGFNIPVEPRNPLINKAEEKPLLNATK